MVSFKVIQKLQNIVTGADGNFCANAVRPQVSNFHIPCTLLGKATNTRLLFISHKRSRLCRYVCSWHYKLGMTYKCNNTYFYFFLINKHAFRFYGYLIEIKKVTLMQNYITFPENIHINCNLTCWYWVTQWFCYICEGQLAKNLQTYICRRPPLNVLFKWMSQVQFWIKLTTENNFDSFLIL